MLSCHETTPPEWAAANRYTTMLIAGMFVIGEVLDAWFRSSHNETYGGFSCRYPELRRFLGGGCAPILTGLVVDRMGNFVGALVLTGCLALLSAVLYGLALKKQIPM